MKHITYSKDIAGAIKDYLNENEWYFSFDEEDGIFQFGVAISGRIPSVYNFVEVKKDSYAVFAYTPIGADASDSKIMSDMAEFICRANYGLDHGNFELDMDDGEIRYKCFVDCSGSLPTADMIENSIQCPAAMFEQYGEGIVEVMSGTLTAKEAVEKCENDTEDGPRAMFSETGDNIKIQLSDSVGGNAE